jgi:hypothetical protein
MTFEEFIKEFYLWSINNVEIRQENTNFSICPYAKKARLDDKIYFIDCSREIIFNPTEIIFDNYQIAILWLDKNIGNLDNHIKLLNDKYPKLTFFKSTTDSGYFAKNFTNCIFVQQKDDLLEKRNFLKNTDYYKNWPAWYYNKIIHESNGITK